MMLRNRAKKIANQILKNSATQKFSLILQLDRNAERNLEKILGSIKGFVDITSNKLQLNIPVSINTDTTNIADFENELNVALRRKSLTNVKFLLVRNVGRVRPVR